MLTFGTVAMSANCRHRHGDETPGPGSAGEATVPNVEFGTVDRDGLGSLRCSMPLLSRKVTVGPTLGVGLRHGKSLRIDKRNARARGLPTCGLQS